MTKARRDRTVFSHARTMLCYTVATIMIAAFVVVSGCGGGSGSGKTAPAKDEFRRQTVSVAGVVDKKLVTPGSVAAVRVIEKTGMLSQPLATTTDFKNGFFLCDNINFYVLKKKGFIVEFRDVTLRRKLVWNIGDRFNNTGKLDEATTFIADNVTEVLKEKKTPAQPLGFFFRNFNDVDISSLIVPQDHDLLRERARTFRRMLEIWSKLNVRDIEPAVEWAALGFAAEPSREREDMRKCLVLLMLLDDEEFSDMSIWRRPLFIAFSDLVYTIAAEAAVAGTNEKRRTRNTEKLFLTLIEQVSGDGDKVLATALRGDPEADAALPEKTVDAHFAGREMKNLDYDSGRLLQYLVTEAKRKTQYNRSVSAMENVRRLFSRYNRALADSGFDEKLESSLIIDIAKLSGFENIDLKSMAKQTERGSFAATGTLKVN